MKVYIAVLTCALLGNSAAAWARQDQAPANTMQQDQSAQNPPPKADATRSIVDFQSQAHALMSKPADPRHPAEIQALRTLADALDAMPGAGDNVKKEAASIRADADTLERSPVTAVHSDTTKDALTDAVAALDDIQKAQNPPGMSDKVKAAHDAVDKIDASVPFLKERATIDNAFVAVSDALVVAGGPAVSQAIMGQERQPVAGQEEVTTPQVVAAPAPVKRPPEFQLSVGGGVEDFAEHTASVLTKVGGEWDVRLSVGENSIIAGEVAYVGTANGVNNVMAQFASNGTILGSGIEADAKLQVPAMLFPVRPFAFLGVGWNNYTLVDENFRNPAAIENSDNAVVMPWGFGIQFDPTQNLALDVRYTYRTMFDEDLIHTTNTGIPGAPAQGMSQNVLSARLGYMF